MLDWKAFLKWPQSLSLKEEKAIPAYEEYNSAIQGHCRDCLSSVFFKSPIKWPWTSIRVGWICHVIQPIIPSISRTTDPSPPLVYFPRPCSSNANSAARSLGDQQHSSSSPRWFLFLPAAASHPPHNHSPSSYQIRYNMKKTKRQQSVIGKKQRILLCVRWESADLPTGWGFTVTFLLSPLILLFSVCGRHLGLGIIYCYAFEKED